MTLEIRMANPVAPPKKTHLGRGLYAVERPRDGSPNTGVIIEDATGRALCTLDFDVYVRLLSFVDEAFKTKTIITPAAEANP